MNPTRINLKQPKITQNDQNQSKSVPEGKPDPILDPVFPIYAKKSEPFVFVARNLVWTRIFIQHN